MSQRIATLMIRSRDSHGERRFYRAFIAPNGNAKPLFAIVAGQPELRPDGIYYLRYRERDGTRRYQYIGKDPQLARLVQVQRQHLINDEDLGLPSVEGPKVPPPVKVAPAELPSVVPLIHRQRPKPDRTYSNSSSSRSVRINSSVRGGLLRSDGGLSRKAGQHCFSPRGEPADPRQSLQPTIRRAGCAKPSALCVTSAELFGGSIL
jgi:hypothetical protein